MRCYDKTILLPGTTAGSVRPVLASPSIIPAVTDPVVRLQMEKQRDHLNRLLGGSGVTPTQFNSFRNLSTIFLILERVLKMREGQRLEQALFQVDLEERQYLDMVHYPDAWRLVFSYAVHGGEGITGDLALPAL